MTKMMKISIAKDFSAEPIGRFYSDGKYSGEAFRQEILLPALEKHSIIHIDLDGTEGYGSSFLEEAFGGAVRNSNVNGLTLFERIIFTSEEDPSLIEEIRSYMLEAKQGRKS